jgi:O-antigen/teichoic acid export membrane protein
VSETPESRGTLNRLLTVFAKESGISLVGRVFGFVMQLATLVILTNLLTLPEYGIFVLAWTVSQFVALFAQVGLDKGVIKYGTEALNRKDGSLSSVLIQSVAIHTVIALLFSAAMYASAQWMAESVFHKPELTSPLRMLAIMVPVLSGMHVIVAITRISKKMTYSVFCEKVLQPVTQFGLTILFIAGLGMRVDGAIIAMGASYGIGFLAGVVLSLKLYAFTGSSRLINLPLAWDILRYSFPTSMAAVFAKTNSWVDRLMIGYFLAAGSVGVYHAASKISASFMVLASMFHGIFAVLAADLIAKKETANLNGIYRANTKWGLYVALPLFLIILFHADSLMHIFGAQYARGGGPLVVLAAGQLVNIGTGSVGLVLMMGGQQNRWMMVSMIMFAVNIFGNFLLIPIWGLWGAAIATSGSVATMFIIGVFMARKHVGVWPYDRRFVKGLLAALIACVVPLGLILVPIKNPAVELFISVPLILLVYGIALYRQGLDEDDRWILTRVRRRLGGVRNITA